MKLFIDGYIFAKQRWGGISRMWREILPRLSDQGMEIDLLLPFVRNNFPLAELIRQNQKISVRKDYFYWPFRFFERVSVRSCLLESLYLDKTIDVFHSTYYSTVYNRRMKKVVTVYDMILERFPEYCPRRWREWGMAIKRAVVENADEIIAISQNTKADILRFYKNLNDKKITIIYPGITVPARNPEINFDTVVNKLSLPIETGSYLLYVGNRNGYKNFSVIVSALEKKLVQPGLTFLCVGGEDASSLLSQISEKGLGKHFKFVDYADDDELAMLYRHAWALVFPSKYEGFGLPVLEAMANDCPVICSRSSAFPEVAGDAAILFDPESPGALAAAIEELQTKNRDDMIKKGRINFSRFSVDASVRRLAALYREM